MLEFKNVKRIKNHVEQEAMNNTKDKTGKQIQRELDLKQREKLREFDAELFSYTGQVAWFLPAIFSFILLVLLSIPIQEIIKDDGFFIVQSILCSLWITYLVLLPYVRVTDAFAAQTGKHTIFEKLKYLPVSKKQYRIVRMGYLFRYVIKITVIGLLIQCISALCMFKKVTFLNLIYVIIILLVLPLIVGWLQLLLDTKEYRKFKAR